MDSSLIIAAFERAHDLIFIAKMNNDFIFEIVYASPSVKTVLLHEPETLLGSPLLRNDLFPKNVRVQLVDIMKDFDVAGKCGRSFHVRLQHHFVQRSGALLFFDSEITEHPSLPNHVLFVSHDITRLRKME